MAGKRLQPDRSAVWQLAREQQGVISRGQLLELGFSTRAIEHRMAIGRLHSLHRGIYAVGRPDVTRRGHWMAAVLRCGPAAVLSHASAAALWGIRSEQGDQIEAAIGAADKLEG
jgi:putative AbiEi antitoxin of type IV toxin-antitoxin system